MYVGRKNITHLASNQIAGAATINPIVDFINGIRTATGDYVELNPNALGGIDIDVSIEAIYASMVEAGLVPPPTPTPEFDWDFTGGSFSYGTTELNRQNGIYCCDAYCYNDNGTLGDQTSYLTQNAAMNFVQRTHFRSSYLIFGAYQVKLVFLNLNQLTADRTLTIGTNSYTLHDLTYRVPLLVNDKLGNRQVSYIGQKEAPVQMCIYDMTETRRKYSDSYISSAHLNSRRGWVLHELLKPEIDNGRSIYDESSIAQFLLYMDLDETGTDTYSMTGVGDVTRHLATISHNVVRNSNYSGYNWMNPITTTFASRNNNIPLATLTLRNYAAWVDEVRENGYSTQMVDAYIQRSMMPWRIIWTPGNLT